MKRRHILILSSLLLIAGNATAQETPPEGTPPADGKLKKAGFDLKDYETQMVDKKQLAAMEKISKTRTGMIQKLETLLRNRPLYPRKAEVFFRLGEYYWEEAKYQYLKARRKYDADYEAFEDKRLAVEPVEPKEDYSRALEYYRKVIQQFPDYPRIDEVMFFLGRGALAQGKQMQDRNLTKEGVQYFQKLVQNYPKSRFIAQTHLALGEHFFETDSLYYAKTNYEKIINNHPKVAMYNYALYKLGWVYFNLREFRKTVTTFQKVVENIGNSTGQVSFRDQALNDLVKTYAEMDDSWREALDYFKGVIKAEDDVYVKMEKLASLYVGFDKDKEALELYNHFIDRTPNNSKIPEWLGSILEVRKKINDFGLTEKEIRRIVNYFETDGRWMNANKNNAEATAEAERLAEVNLLFLANHWHLSAEKAEKQKNNELAKDLYTRAAADYKLFLSRFPQSKQAYLISYYYAEILYHQIKNYEEAMARYQAVIKLDKKGKFVEDAALGVIYSSYELMIKEGLVEKRERGTQLKRIKLSKKELDAAKKEDAKIERTELHRLEKAYISAADSYVGLLLELRQDPEFVKKYPKRGEMIPEVMYMAADTYYRHGMFSESVDRLNKIFAYDAKHKFAAIAAVRIIQAYARLRRWNRVEEWARKLIKERNYKFKTEKELKEYIAIAINENAIDLMKQRKTDDAIAESNRLIKEFKSNKELACKARMNLAVLYERAKRIKDAVGTYETVVKVCRKQDVASEAQYVIGVIYESQTRFAEAADAFLKMEKFKKSDKTPDAIVNAGLIREALGDNEGAIKAFQRYLKLFGKNDDAADVFFKIGLLMEKVGDPKTLKKAVKHYSTFARKYPSRYVMKVEGYSRAGDILRRLDQLAAAKKNEKLKEGQRPKKVYKNRRKATALFEQSLGEYQKAVQQVATLRGSEKVAKAATAKNYAAQSAYWLADYIFQDFDDARIKSTRPNALKKELITKAELHQKAEQAFDGVLGMGSANWLACAAYRNGLLYFNFAKELFDVPIPFGLSPDQEDQYRALLEEMGAPIQEKSLILLRAALEAAHQKGVYNTCSKNAGVYAAKVNPEGYPIDGDDQVDPNSTKDTLLAANFIRFLKRGNTAVDMLKKTTKDLKAESK